MEEIKKQSSKKILIINGHPNKESFNYAIAETYKESAEHTGAEVKEIVIQDLTFDVNLKYGYQKRTELEPDLLHAWELIQWAEHMVWVHPVWWGGFPAIMKGFIDRLFLPGFVFKHKENSLFWNKYLKGKSARIITTLDQPSFIYRLLFGRPSVNQLRKSILEFCGVKPVKVTYVGIIRTSTDAQRNKWLDKIRMLGMKQL